MHSVNHMEKCLRTVSIEKFLRMLPEAALRERKERKKKNIGVMPSKWSTCRSGYYLKVQEQENKQALKSHQICEEDTNGRDK